MKTTVLAIACASLAFGSAAFAGDRDYAFELDLRHANTLSGAEALYGEIEAQAERICDIRHRRSLGERRAELDCEADVVENAVAQVDRPLLTALHNGETRQRLAEIASTVSAQ